MTFLDIFSRLPVRLPIDDDRGRAWRRGDAVELAGVMREHIERVTGAPLVHDLGDFWAYDQDSATWCAVSPETMAAAFSLFAGTNVCKSRDPDTGEMKLKPLVLNDTMAFVRQLRSEVAGREETGPGFFRGTRGLTFADWHLEAVGPVVVRYPRGPERRSRRGVPYPYEGGKPPARFLRLLGEQWPDLIDDVGALLTQFIGAALLGEAPRMNRALLFVGPAGSGKSTLLDAIERCFPAEVVTHLALQDFGHEFKPACLRDSLLNTVRELEDAPILRQGQVRAIIGGEPLHVNVKYRPGIDIRPQAAHIFAMNELPTAPGADQAFWRRFAVLRFTRQFRGTAQDDRGLADALAEERADIVRWCIDRVGFALEQGDYTISEGLREAAAEWRVEADPVSYWYSEADIVDGWSEVKDLYEHFAKWARASGFREISLRSFSQRLRQIEEVKFRHGSKTRRAEASFRVRGFELYS